MATRKGSRSSGRQIGYAVVGLGHIAQTTVLPAFANTKNSRLVALVSGDAQKQRRLAKLYGAQAYSYDRFDDCLASGDVDAVYIALPNTMHAEYAVRAAKAGAHVLCEKPMAGSEAECRAMIRAAEEADVKLMVAYRLHFEPANMQAVAAVRSGRLGEPRLFASTFSYQVQAENIRLRRDTGGGPLWDIGIYCLNAARYLFQAEPEEVLASTAESDEARFAEVEEALSTILRFPDERLASFSCSYNAAPSSRYQLLGTKGTLELENAYEYEGERILRTQVGGRSRERRFAESDQFGPELEYFSRCVLEDRTPEPSGEEGLADVRAILAIYRSAATRRAVKLAPFQRAMRPGPGQIIEKPTRAAKAMVEVRAPVAH